MLSAEVKAIIRALERIMLRRTVYRHTISKKSGMSYERVRAILNGDCDMSLQEYLLISHACGVDPTVPLACASVSRRTPNRGQNDE